MELEERFWSKADWDAHDEGRCWEWQAALMGGDNGPKKYGSFWFAGATVLAHRMAYELEVGPIPEGLQLDHTCRNRKCVNPSHLEPVTCKENLLRGDTLNSMNAAKTHCKNGHEFTPENTQLRKSGAKKGTRRCRECERGHCKKWYRKQA